jgi:hypothetical protein
MKHVEQWHTCDICGSKDIMRAPSETHKAYICYIKYQVHYGSVEEVEDICHKCAAEIWKMMVSLKRRSHNHD